MSDYQSATARDIITDSLTEILANTPGEPISESEMSYGIRMLNRLMGQFSIIRTFAYNIRSDTFTFASAKQSYTIGPSGADFTGPRPTRILEANLVINTSTPVDYRPLDLLDYQQWAALRVRAIPVTVPTKLYYQSNYVSPGDDPTTHDPLPGFGTLWFWGIPAIGFQVELFTPEQLTNFADLSTEFVFPPGYEMMVVKTLAEYLAPTYGKTVSQDLKDQARKARAALQSLNSPCPKLNSDVPAGRGPGDYFNWLTGNF